MLNKRSPHRDNDALAAFALQSDAQLELGQQLVLAVADCTQHGQAWEQPALNQRSPD